MLQATDLQFAYKKEALLRFPNLQLDQAQHTLLLGASGSGKTTWLHLLGGLRQPSSGQIFYGETELTALKNRALDRFRGRHIGLVFQQPHLITALSVLGNLKLACRLGGAPWEEAFAEHLLENLGLVDKAHKGVQQLSGGEAQRVALARALINRPQVVLADEPTASLDDAHCAQVVDLLLRTAQDHEATLIMATHDHRVKDHFSHTYTL